MGTKINQLPLIATTNGADELPISQDTGSGRITYKTTLDQINNFVRNAGSIGTVTSVSVTSPDNSISTFGNPIVGSGTVTLSISSVKLEKIDSGGATNAQVLKYNEPLKKWEAGNISLSGFDASLLEDGYQKISSGLIMQWGKHTEASATADTFYKITFPLPFPTQCFNVVVTNQDSTSTNSSTILANTPTFSSVDIAWNTAGAHSVFWQAIGY